MMISGLSNSTGSSESNFYPLGPKFESESKQRF